MVEEHPDARRERRLAEARKRRGSAEWAADGAELERAREAERALARQRSTAGGRKTPENSPDYFGVSWTRWFELRDRMVDYLVECARGERTAPYHEVWAYLEASEGSQVQNAWRAQPKMLEHASELSVQEYGVLLTALVVNAAGEQMPSEGFFRLAVREGLLASSEFPPMGEPWVMTDGQRAFAQAAVEQAFARFRPGGDLSG